MEIPHPYHYLKAHLFNSRRSAIKVATTTLKSKDLEFAGKLLSAKNGNTGLTKEKLAKNRYLQIKFNNIVYTKKLLSESNLKSHERVEKILVKNNATSHVETSTSESKPLHEISDNTSEYEDISNYQHTDESREKFQNKILNDSNNNQIIFAPMPWDSLAHLAAPPVPRKNLHNEIKAFYKSPSEEIYSKVNISKKRNRQAVEIKPIKFKKSSKESIALLRADKSVRLISVKPLINNL